MTATSEQQTTTTPDARRTSRFLLLGGVVFTVAAVIIMVVADPAATVRLRSSEMGTWALLLPSVLAVFLGVYGMTVRKAYESPNSAKAFTTVGVLLALLFLRMAYGVVA